MYRIALRFCVFTLHHLDNDICVGHKMCDGLKGAPLSILLQIFYQTLSLIKHLLIFYQMTIALVSTIQAI